MKPSDDIDPTEEEDSSQGDAEVAPDSEAESSQVAHTVTEIPEKTKHRQRDRRASGAHLGSGLPLAVEGHYQVREEVARGGLGRIVAAYDTRLEREVALKELMVRHPVSEARFEREAKVTARLEHPSIIPVHDAGVFKDGQPFYAMKLVEGKSLASAIASTGSFEERMALLPHVIDVAEAIAYAHSQHIIHRDLKPANILVGAFGETVVIDWGLAKDLTRSRIEDELLVNAGAKTGETAYHTSEGAVLGTPAYMPPEQAAGEVVDERADVYALGALLYQLLVGKRPFFDVPAPELLKVVGRESPVPIAELVPDAPVELQAVVDKAMARDAEERYANAGELADELRRFTTGQLVGAYKYSSKDLLLRFVRRHKRVLLTVAVSVAILLAYGVWSFVQIAREKRVAEDARDVAEEQTVKARAAEASEVAERRKAETRERMLVVEKARLLLKSDPTEAIATLKRLDESMPGAASLVAEAQELGVARHVIRNPELAQIRAVDVAGEVVAWSDEAGHVAVVRDGKAQVLELHGSQRVPALRLSSDGKLLVTGGYDRRVVVTDVGSRQSRDLGTTSGRVLALAVSADHSQVAVLDSSGTISLWPMAGGAPRTWTTAVGRTAFIRLSADGRRMLTGSHQNAALLVDLSTDRATYLNGHRDVITDGRFAPDGTHLATASRDGTVRIWTVDGAPLRTITGYQSAVEAVAFADSGDLLVTGEMNGSVQVAPWRSGGPRLLGSHSERVTDIAFALDSTVVVSASWDKSLRMFAIQGGGKRVLRGHRDVVEDLAVSEDGKTLVTGSWDASVRVWSLSPPGRRVFSGHQVGVKTVDFSPDGNWVASGGHDNQVRLWDVQSGRSRVYSGHQDHVYRVVFSPDGKMLASSSDDETVRIWYPEGDGQRVLRGHRADVEELAWGPSGDWLVSAAEDDTARVWFMDGRPARVLAGHQGPVRDVAVSADGNTIATAGLDGKVLLWTDAEKPKVLDGHDGGVLDLAFAKPGSLVSLANDGKVRLWDTTGGGSVEIAELPGARVLDVSPGLDQVAVGSVGGTVWLCPAAEKMTCRQLIGHRGNVAVVEFSSDGRLLATAGADNTVRIWELASGEHRVLQGHEGPVFDLDFSPDGTQLVSGSSDGKVRIWDVRRPPADLTKVLGELTSYEVD